MNVLRASRLAAVLVAVAAVAVAYLFYIDSLEVPVVHDALGYTQIAKQIRQHGIFHQYPLSDLRTYGYPAVLGYILAGAALAGAGERGFVFAVQLLLHIA